MNERRTEHQPAEAPDRITLEEPVWMAEWRAYVDDLDTSLEGQDEHLIHQDGFAAGWTLGQEAIQAEADRLTAEVAFRKEQIGELVDQRDAAQAELVELRAVGRELRDILDAPVGTVIPGAEFVIQKFCNLIDRTEP